jgi:hypothetical protein
MAGFKRELLYPSWVHGGCFAKLVRIVWLSSVVFIVRFLKYGMPILVRATFQFGSTLILKFAVK